MIYFFVSATFPRYNCIFQFTHIHSHHGTTETDHSSASFHTLIFLHIHREPSGDLWMGVIAVNVGWATGSDWLWGKAVLLLLQITELNRIFPFLSDKRYQHPPLCTFYHKHLHLCTTVLAALSPSTTSQHSKAECTEKYMYRAAI